MTLLALTLLMMLLYTILEAYIIRSLYTDCL